MRPGLLLTRDDAEVLFAAVALSAALALLIAGVVRRALLALPVDFLAYATAAPSSRARSVARAIVSAALVGAGAAMLVLPGPGVLLITLGLLAWKTRREPLRAVLARPLVLRWINALRGRNGRPALAPTSSR